MVFIVKVDVDLKPVADLGSTFMIKSIHEDAFKRFRFKSVMHSLIPSRHHFQ